MTGKAVNKPVVVDTWTYRAVITVLPRKWLILNCGLWPNEMKLFTPPFFHQGLSCRHRPLILSHPRRMAYKNLSIPKILLLCDYSNLYSRTPTKLPNGNLCRRAWWQPGLGWWWQAGKRLLSNDVTVCGECRRSWYQGSPGVHRFCFAKQYRH